MMGRILLVCGAAVTVTARAQARDPLKGQLELSLGGALQSLTVIEGGTSESFTFLNLPVRAGYFVTEGLEVEGEMVMSVWEGGVVSGSGETQVAAVVSANLAYNFSPAARVRPFVLGGVGVADAALPPIANATVLADADGTTRAILNFGTGFKSLVGSRAALRVEYRFQLYPEDAAQGLPGLKSHTLQAGASLFVL